MSKKKLVELYVEEEQLLFTAAAQIQLQLSEDRRRWRKRSIWTRCWLQRRQFYGRYEHLIYELIREDERGFSNYTSSRTISTTGGEGLAKIAEERYF